MDLTSLITSISLLLVTHFPKPVTSVGCSISKCGDSDNPVIRFPFRFKDLEQPVSCGSPGFDVSCDPVSQNTLIDLPHVGNLTIKNIDYAAQEIWVNDPDNCLPKKLLHFNLSNSPFSGVYDQYFSFFNCSTTIKNDNKSHIIGPINCLSGSIYFVYATPSNGTVLLPHAKCIIIAPVVKVPVQRPPSLHDGSKFSTSLKLDEDLRLSWFMSECQTCELNGQMCELGTNSSGSQIIVCSNIPSNNGTKDKKLPFTTVIAVILVICSPSIICIVVSLYIWIRACYYRQRSAQSIENGPVVTQRPARQGQMMELGLQEFNVEFARQVVLLGLRNESGPEFQPTIVFSEIEEMGQSPTREGGSSCAICMGEYEAKDRIGSLPMCGHYFHADCINKWLLQSPGIIIGRTCPICRARVG